jgi:hypothetical protein
MSSSSDQKKGSANFLFTRQNYGQPHSGHVYLHPSVFLRTSNYAFEGDHFGYIADRKSSANFDLSKVAGIHGGSNELLIKNGISILDGFGLVFFHSAAMRNAAVEIMKKAGVDHLHGIPIEELFVSDSVAASKARKKIWEAALAAEKENQ